MKTIPSLLICLIVAFWAIAMAILSVQNAVPVSLRFFGLQSIQIPVGIALGLSAGVGIATGAIAQMLQGNNSDDFQSLPRAKPAGASTRTTGKNYEIASDDENW